MSKEKNRVRKGKAAAGKARSVSLSGSGKEHEGRLRSAVRAAAARKDALTRTVNKHRKRLKIAGMILRTAGKVLRRL